MTPQIHPNFPDYVIHPDGRVFRFQSNGDGRQKIGEMCGRVLVSGYRQFKLVDANGKQVSVRANRLVCEAFRGPAPSPSHQAAHEDGVRLNNAAGNLEWKTPKANTMDQNIHGTRRRGARMQNAALTDEQLAEVRASFTGKRGEVAAMARKYGTGNSTMCRIVHGQSYSTSPQPVSLAHESQLD